MKMKNLLFTAFIAVLLTSCASNPYFQVFKASPTEKIGLKENMLVYEDENCKVSYNLWSEGGNIGFRFFNKSDKNIYLNLEESFFIVNGEANNYYKNRVFTSSTLSGQTVSRGTKAVKSVSTINYLDLLQTNSITSTSAVGNINASGSSVSFNEEKIVCIPPTTSKTISEYNINQSLIRDCDLYKYPKKKQIKTKSFIKLNSPLIFKNSISYSVGQSSNLMKFENEFYISEVSNYPQSAMFETKREQFCGQKDKGLTQYFKNASPDKFYIKYSKVDKWKH